jgi:acetylornithine deacetylase
MTNEQLFQDAVALLKELIAIPSFSKEEDRTADAIERFLLSQGVTTERIGHNILARNRHFDPSHHDTVKPNKSYTLDPFTPVEKDGKLYGLGSNDAGGCLVSLIATFLHFHERRDLAYNIVLAATAEEEISGTNGIELALTKLPEIHAAIVGEPTKMDLAVAERGLLVLDCVAHGRSGHAARNEGENALYKALQDIKWMSSYAFPRSSDLLGPVKMTVTVIETNNKAHNVVPDTCTFVADVRINEQYRFEEVIEEIRAHVQSEIKPRSLRMRSSMIPLEHPLVQAGLALGRNVYGSPTTSDKALMPFPALKMGPGDSARSHTADEFIFVDEIRQGISLYIDLLSKIVTIK